MAPERTGTFGRAGRRLVATLRRRVSPRDEPIRAESPGELKERIGAERDGSPHLIYRSGDGAQVIRSIGTQAEPLSVGRTGAVDLLLDFDPEVSRLHAQLERLGEEWVVVDDGLSRNGTFVNGERVVARRRLRDGDAIRFGETVVVFRAPGSESEETRVATDESAPRQVSDTQRRVLIALCRPYRDGSDFAAAATNKEIADEVFLSVDAVKAHLRALFERFDVGALPQNQKRIRLAELAIRSGVIAPRDLEG
jgi:pSer/pThr/pTyr-binding forkhead associated (FHA) protein